MACCAAGVVLLRIQSTLALLQRLRQSTTYKRTRIRVPATTAVSTFISPPPEPTALVTAGSMNCMSLVTVEPRGDRDVVVHLDRVLALQAEVEPLAPETGRRHAELGAAEAEPERVIRAARHYAFATNSGQERVLDRVGVSVGTAEREEHAEPMLWVAGGLPEILVGTHR